MSRKKPMYLFVTLLWLAVFMACSLNTPQPATPTAGLQPYPPVELLSYPPPAGAEPGSLQQQPYPGPQGSTLLSTPTESPVLPLQPTPSGSPDDIVSSSPGPAPWQPGKAPWEPQPGDEYLQRGNVFIEEAQIIVLESFPPQFMLHLRGSLPNPCYLLRAQMAPVETEKRILVEVYSLVEPGKICIEVLQPFDVNIPLFILSSGKYTVWVNDKPVGEIEN